MIELFGGAPYAPANAVLDVIEAKRREPKMERLGADLLELMGVRESLIPRTLQALRLLDLIDDEGRVTQQFSRVASPSSAESQAALAGVVRAAYAPVFDLLDPVHAPLVEIERVFMHFQPPSQRPRMVTLFVNLMKAAGMIPEDAPQTAPNGRWTSTASVSSSKRLKSSSPTKQWPEVREAAMHKPAAGTSHTLELQSGGSVHVSLDVDLFTLSKQDRDFVMDLIDRVTSYRTDRPGAPRTR